MAKSVKRFERSNGPDIALYKNYLYLLFDTVLRGRNEFVNAKDNELNSASISLLWHPPAMLWGVHINVAAWHTATVGNVKIALSENIALLLHRHVDVPCSLDVT